MQSLMQRFQTYENSIFFQTQFINYAKAILKWKKTRNFIFLASKNFVCIHEKLIALNDFSFGRAPSAISRCDWFLHFHFEGPFAPFQSDLLYRPEKKRHKKSIRIKNDNIYDNYISFVTKIRFHPTIDFHRSPRQLTTKSRQINYFIPNVGYDEHRSSISFCYYRRLFNTIARIPFVMLR